MDAQSEIAALWGSAENVAYSTEQRLQFALAALTKMATLLPEGDE